MSPSTPHPITTTGISSTITTTKNSGESVSDWVDRHDKEVKSSTPSGNTLTTTYTSNQGSETVTTDRSQGESDAEFRARHETDYLERMVVRPPIP